MAKNKTTPLNSQQEKFIERKEAERILRGTKKILAVIKRVKEKAELPYRNVLYIIKCGEYHKIGYAADFQSRLQNLGIGNPYQLDVVLVFKTDQAKELEKEFHKLFSEKHHKGEWFILNEDDLILIKKRCQK